MPHLRHVEMVQFNNNVLEGSIVENRNYILAIAICNFDSVEVKFITPSTMICSRTSTSTTVDQFFHTTGFISFL